jgi:hypothetical protein
MPRKKRETIAESEPISVLQPESESNEVTSEQAIEQPHIDPESCNRNYLTASLQSVQASVSQLFAKQCQISGTQAADAAFDAFEIAFISRLEERLQPFVDVLVPEIRDSHAQLQERTITRVERRLSAFDRLKQITGIITDECKLLPPVVAVGEFVTWEPVTKEND